jgi:hypothetical protein
VSGGSIKVTHNTNKKDTVEVLLPDTTVPISPRKRVNGQKAVEAGVIEQTPPAAQPTPAATAATGTATTAQSDGADGHTLRVNAVGCLNLVYRY